MLDGFGHRIIGDDLSALGPNDIVLIGANLPHVYKFDDFLDKPHRKPCCLLVQFDASLWASLLELPVFAPTRSMLDRAALGLYVTGKTRDKVDGLMRKMTENTPGVKRVALFIQILDVLSGSRDCHRISSSFFSPSTDLSNKHRVNCVCRYINENLQRQINVAEAARLANLSEGAFSRFFRLHFGKTFPAMVNEQRIGRACHLLAETDMAITQIAMSCGYNNLSNFNRQFLKLKGITPREFRTRIPASS